MNEDQRMGVGIWVGIVSGLWIAFFLFHLCPWEDKEFLWWYFPAVASIFSVSFGAFVLIGATVAWILEKLHGDNP